MDYFVHDNNVGDGALVDAIIPTDAAQKFIDIIARELPGRYVDPFDLSIYPVKRRNTIVAPENMTDHETM